MLGHDLHAAYRQFPVKEPGHSAMLLATPDGPTLWLHMAMCFGAAASVWNFNRAADALQQLLRVLLLIAAGHFVDDFTAIEDILTAASAFQSFEELFGLLGLRVKPSTTGSSCHPRRCVWTPSERRSRPPSRLTP